MSNGPGFGSVRRSDLNHTRVNKRKNHSHGTLCVFRSFWKTFFHLQDDFFSEVNRKPRYINIHDPEENYPFPFFPTLNVKRENVVLSWSLKRVAVGDSLRIQKLNPSLSLFSGRVTFLRRRFSLPPSLSDGSSPPPTYGDCTTDCKSELTKERTLHWKEKIVVLKPFYETCLVTAQPPRNPLFCLSSYVPKRPLYTISLDPVGTLRPYSLTLYPLLTPPTQVSHSRSLNSRGENPWEPFGRPLKPKHLIVNICFYTRVKFTYQLSKNCLHIWIH